MKRILLLSAAALGMSLGAYGADAAPKAPPAEKKTTETTKAPEKEKAAKAEKPMPMTHKIDSIDAKAMTLSYTTEKGLKVVNTVTDKTEITNDGKPAKFSDIKEGDTVDGSRIKKSDSAYEVVKITKFGPAATKEKPTAKTDTKTAPSTKTH